MKKLEVLRTLSLVGACALVFVLITAAAGPKWNVPDSAAKVKNPVAASAENIETGKQLFLKNCKSCHGLKGKGDGPKAANLDVECGDFTSDAFKKESDGAIFWKTTEGRDPMPTFKNKISDSDRWTIINYIRTLGK